MGYGCRIMIVKYTLTKYGQIRQKYICDYE